MHGKFVFPRQVCTEKKNCSGSTYVVIAYEGDILHNKHADGKSQTYQTQGKQTGFFGKISKYGYKESILAKHLPVSGLYNPFQKELIT